MKVGKRIRHLQRYREIAVAFVRNGFGYVVNELGFPETFPFLRQGERRDIHKKSIGERIRLLLEDLGPTFVKLGQIASTRPDLLPADVISELVRLQDKVPAFTYEEAVGIIEEELGSPVSEVFAHFPRIPIAAASIGQVYRAALQDGTDVAVKVQRPHIQQMIETDLDILAELARLAESRLEWARNYRVRDVVEEITKALHAELDYTTEARQAEKFIAQCQQLEGVCVPHVYWDYTTRRVLTMEFLMGIKLSDREQLDKEGHSRTGIARKFAQIIFHQILIEGLFHGDPHPGNVLVLPDGTLALLDFGLVGRLSPEMKRQFATFVIALRNQSTNGVIRAISNMGIVPDEADLNALRVDVDEMREKYYETPLSRVSLGEAVNDLFTLAFRHRIRIPSEMTVLGKTLLTMEGVVVALDPSFSVFEVAEPYGRRLFRERLDPRNLVKKAIEEAPEFLDMLTEMPSGIRNIAAAMRKGKFKLEMNVPELGSFLKKMDMISNKLSFSIVLLSFSIVLVGLIIGASLASPDTVLWNLPVHEIGFVIAIIMLSWLLYSFFRSGRF
ncbi:MAG: transporter [Paenibacillaceae bacterium]|jgi:ubiquinone biosynthesis protein|nr:transporter [Paenibacillaceae bacterium]